MSLIASALAPQMMSTLLDLRTSSESTTLSDLFGAGQRTGFYVNFDNNNKTTLVDFRDVEIIKSTFAFDISRFSTSSFQSVCTLSIDFESENYIAWSLIRIYYAAFYAAHALIRMFGLSCSFFERSHINRIQGVGQALGIVPSFKMDKGLYLVSVSPGLTGFNLKKIGANHSGSHEAFWAVFFSTLRSAGDKILIGSLPPSDSQRVFAVLNSAISSLQSDGWLSFIRNEIQYRHAYGLWFPANAKKKMKSDLVKLSSAWLLDPMEIEFAQQASWEIETFMTACSFIVSLCRSMTKYINSSSSAGTRCYTTAGPMRFLQQGNYAGD